MGPLFPFIRINAKTQKKVLRRENDHADEITLSEFKKLVWDDNVKYELCQLLESIETKNRLNRALNNNNVDAMTELFAQNLIDVCNQAGLRFNNTTRKHLKRTMVRRAMQHRKRKS